MPHAISPNYVPTTNTDRWSVIWKLTRTLKAAGWRYKASSDAVAKESTGNPNSDKWGGGVQVGSQTGTLSFTLSTPTTTAKAGRQTVTGLSGFVATSAGVRGSPGNFLKITGATNGTNNGTWLITKYISASSVEIENPIGVAETTPGSATWQELSSTLDTIPGLISGSSGAGAWWCAEGPSTMRIPIGTSIPTGTFIRGENVTQATTGATGEIIGVMTDPAGIMGGHLVIAPRLSGTGAAVRGWDSSSTITGGSSGATIAPTGTPLEYIREIVIWKSTIVFGHAYFQTIESVTEATTTSISGRFSTMAFLGTCTAVIPPGGASGGNPLTNGFPTLGTMALWGTGGANAHGTTSANYNLNSVGATIGTGQLICANNIEDANVSQDGSYICAIGQPLTNAGAFGGHAFQRLDDTEEGDIDPYVFLLAPSGANYNRIRTADTANLGSNGEMFTTAILTASAYTPYKGWRRRGFPTQDGFQEFSGCIMGSFNTTAILALNSGTVDKVATAPVSTVVRDPLWIISVQFGQKCRKGTCRWLYSVPTGSGTDTYDGKRWVQLSTVFVSYVGGPWDQTTIPSNA